MLKQSVLASSLTFSVAPPCVVGFPATLLPFGAFSLANHVTLCEVGACLARKSFVATCCSPGERVATPKGDRLVTAPQIRPVPVSTLVVTSTHVPSSRCMRRRVDGSAAELAR